MSLTRKKAVAMVKMIPVMTWDATKALTLFLWEIARNPRVLKEKLAEAQYHLKEVNLTYLCSLNSPLKAKPCNANQWPWRAFTYSRCSYLWLDRGIDFRTYKYGNNYVIG